MAVPVDLLRNFVRLAGAIRLTNDRAMQRGEGGCSGRKSRDPEAGEGSRGLRNQGFEGDGECSGGHAQPTVHGPGLSNCGNGVVVFTSARHVHVRGRCKTHKIHFSCFGPDLRYVGEARVPDGPQESSPGQGSAVSGPTSIARAPRPPHGVRCQETRKLPSKRKWQLNSEQRQELLKGTGTYQQCLRCAGSLRIPPLPAGKCRISCRAVVSAASAAVIDLRDIQHREARGYRVLHREPKPTAIVKKCVEITVKWTPLPVGAVGGAC